VPLLWAYIPRSFFFLSYLVEGTCLGTLTDSIKGAVGVGMERMREPNQLLPLERMSPYARLSAGEVVGHVASRLSRVRHQGWSCNQLRDSRLDVLQFSGVNWSELHFRHFCSGRRLSGCYLTPNPSSLCPHRGRSPTSNSRTAVMRMSHGATSASTRASTSEFRRAVPYDGSAA
jgi:hypothetical protein